MLLPDHELIVINNEHSSLNSSSISVDLNFSLFNISDNGVLFRQRIGSSCLFDVVKELIWRGVVTDPLAVQEHFI